MRSALAICNSMIGDIPSNIDTLKKMSIEAASKGAELICFPEMSLTGYYNNQELLNYAFNSTSPYLSDISSIASDYSVAILAGFAELGNNETLFAAHGVFYPDGRVEIYRKIHIAPPEKNIFEQGYSIPVFEYKGIKFGIQLCYDAHFPELTTKMSVLGIDALFIPHASPRGTSEEKMKSWLRHLTARAFDNGILVAACNQVGENGKGLSFPGIALVISPSGELFSSCLTVSDELLYFDISKNEIDEFRSSRMRYFLPNRRTDLFSF